MWGPSISGHSGTSCRAGFLPRKAALVFYAMGGLAESAAATALLERLGKHTSSKGCPGIKRLDAADLARLESLVALSWKQMNAMHPAGSFRRLALQMPFRRLIQR